MAQNRTWTQRNRSAEECLQVLRSSDERSLQRRAERLSILVSIQTDSEHHMPSRTDALLSEASNCFTDGQYTGCILSLATGVEHGLRQLLSVQENADLDRLIKAGLDELIKAGVARGVVSNSQARVLHAMKDYRNQATHSYIDDLAAGKMLQRKKIVLTESGVTSASDWEEFKPESQDHKEIAADLSAESKVGQHLVNVREILYDIFDRHSELARTLGASG